MGKAQAEEMMLLTQQGVIDEDQMIEWHLTSNHFPPVHRVFVETAKEAIRLANEGNWDAEVTMPNGLVRTVSFIVDGLHLGEFVNYSE